MVDLLQTILDGRKTELRCGFNEWLEWGRQRTGGLSSGQLKGGHKRTTHLPTLCCPNRTLEPLAAKVSSKPLLFVVATNSMFRSPHPHN